MIGMKKLSIAVTVIGLGVLATGTPARSETLTVAAAPTLRAAFQEIVPMFEQEHAASLHVQYGPSQTFRRQIEQGTPIDVFLPESWQELEALQQKGLTLLGGPRHYAQSTLVLVMSSASPATAISFAEASPNRALHVAVVDPKTSAFGAIAVKALKRLDPFASHYSRIVPAHDTDDVVRLVSGGAAHVGVVHRVDAINSGDVRIIDEAPGGRSIPILFGQAVVSTCRETSLPVAEQFVNFMMSPRIQKLLLKYGFDAMPTQDAVG
jgi:molybdate transport system substrate-binding protein